jgi:hypothetical protein
LNKATDQPANMTANRTIYVIHQSPELCKAWREFSEAQKREIIRDCQTAEEDEIERIFEEVANRQRRLF